MNKRIIFTFLSLAVALTAGTANADSIKGRLGITGRIGFLVPADNKSDFLHNDTDTGLVGGGGLIYGIDDRFAAEFEVTRTSFGSQTGDFGLTDISLGGQYRFQSRDKLVPYLGLGVDILVSDYDPYSGAVRDVDTTLGAHLSGGVDYFLLKQLALTGEARLVLAPNADITDRGGSHVGNFDPTNFSSTFGIRYFFN